MGKTSGKAKVDKWLLFIQAWITGVALFTDLSVEEIEYAGIHNSLLSRLYTMTEQLQQGLQDSGLMLSVLIFGIFLLYQKVWMDMECRPVRGTRGLSAILAVLHVGGLAFYTDNALSVLWHYKVNLLRAGITFLGMYWLYLTAVTLLYLLLNEKPGEISEARASAVSGFFCSFVFCRLKRAYYTHPWLLFFFAILICWLPHWILRYPGAMSYDNYNELMYYYGDKVFTTAQPVFHTWLFGTFVNIGVSIGHPNAGLFGFVVFQSVIMACVLSAMLTLMRRWGVSRRLRILTFLIFVVAPYFTGYAAFPIKDYLYTAFFTAMVLMIMVAVRDPGTMLSGRSCIMLSAAWIICCAAMMLMRNNGLYVYFVTVLLMLPAFVRLYRRHGRRFLLTALICLLLPLGLKEGAEAVLSSAYDVQQDSLKEMFSLPFQQTARYVRDYGDEVTEDEKRAIEAVLDYENLAVLYDESISDPVKTTYHASNVGELIDYLSVWLRQFLKHPLCYVEATWNQCYSLFTLWTDNIVYNQNCNVGVDIWDTESSAFFHFEIPEWMSGFSEIAVSMYSVLTSLPVIGLFSNVAFYVILMFTMLVFFFAEGRRQEAVVMIPLLLSFLFILLSPAVMGQPRYAFPIIYSMPAVVGFYESGSKEKRKEGEAAPASIPDNLEIRNTDSQKERDA